jgi:hypothetical protein
MPDDLRAEIQKAAERRGRSLTQEVIRRLQISLNRERIERQDQIARAICFLISEAAIRVQPEWRPGKWHRDPFTFKAFELAVSKILSALRPPGEPRPPSAKRYADHPLHQQFMELFKTPERAATFAATGILESLFRPRKMTDEDKWIARFGAEADDEAGLGEPFINEMERQFYAMDRAGRVLGLDQSPILGLIRREPKR